MNYKVDDMIKHDDYIGHIVKVLKDNYYEVWFPMIATEYSTEEVHSDEFELATEKDLEL